MKKQMIVMLCFLCMIMSVTAITGKQTVCAASKTQLKQRSKTKQMGKFLRCIMMTLIMTDRKKHLL